MQEKYVMKMLLISLGLFIAGLINCTLAYYNWDLNRIFLADALHTNGTVISFVKANKLPGRTLTKAKCPVIEYINNEKESIQFTHEQCSYPLDFSIGQNVEVYFLPYKAYSILKAQYPNIYFNKERVSKETGIENVSLFLAAGFFAASYFVWKFRKI